MFVLYLTLSRVSAGACAKKLESTDNRSCSLIGEIRVFEWHNVVFHFRTLQFGTYFKMVIYGQCFRGLSPRYGHYLTLSLANVPPKITHTNEEIWIYMVQIKVKSNINKYTKIRVEAEGVNPCI